MSAGEVFSERGGFGKFGVFFFSEKNVTRKSLKSPPRLLDSNMLMATKT